MTVSVHTAVRICRRGHLVSGANIAPWSATKTHCLACSRATSYARSVGRKGDEEYVVTLASMYYRRIVKGAA